MTNKKSKRRTSKKEPSAEAVKWHEGFNTVCESIQTINNLIGTVSQYAVVIKEPVFNGELSEEERTKLTESINVVRIALQALNGVAQPVLLAARAEKNAPYETRNSEKFITLEAELVEANMAFDRDAIQPGHLDNVQEVVTNVTNRLAAKAGEEQTSDKEETNV